MAGKRMIDTAEYGFPPPGGYTGGKADGTPLYHHLDLGGSVEYRRRFVWIVDQRVGRFSDDSGGVWRRYHWIQW